MKLKSLVLAAAMAVAGVAAHASTPTTLTLPTGGVINAVNAVVPGTGTSFSDTYNLDLSGASPVAANFTTTNFSFNDVLNLSDLSLTLYQGVGSGWVSLFTASSVSGLVLDAANTYKLVVSGLTSGTYGGAYTLSYSAQAIAAPVPEPASLALFAAGIGALGLVGRRRKQARQSETDTLLA